MIRIDTERRTHDWIAFVGGDRARWESGATEHEAIGRLIVMRAVELEIDLRRLPENGR